MNIFRRRCQCAGCQLRKEIRREVINRMQAERSIIRRARTWYRNRKGRT
jgi:hypothetical protein